MDWQGFYAGELQGVWLLQVAPLAFLLFLAFLAFTAFRDRPGRPRARASARPGADFVWLYCLVFAVETLVDPLATGPLGRWLGLPDAAKTAVMFTFVWLGDYRVFLLVFGLSTGRGWAAWPRAALFTCIVPVVAGVVHFGIAARLWPGLPDQTLWLVYEIGFCALALALRARLADPFLRSALAYVAAYYALWASSDVIILAGADVGWALRIAPNQLYYGFWIPFVFWTFFFRPDMTRK